MQRELYRVYDSGKLWEKKEKVGMMVVRWKEKLWRHVYMMCLWEGDAKQEQSMITPSPALKRKASIQKKGVSLVER